MQFTQKNRMNGSSSIQNERSYCHVNRIDCTNLVCIQKTMWMQNKRRISNYRMFIISHGISPSQLSICELSECARSKHIHQRESSSRVAFRRRFAIWTSWQSNKTFLTLLLICQNQIQFFSSILTIAFCWNHHENYSTFYTKL